MLSFREVSILLPFVATFPAQNLSLPSLKSRPTKGQKAENGTFSMETLILARRRQTGDVLSSLRPLPSYDHLGLLCVPAAMTTMPAVWTS